MVHARPSFFEHRKASEPRLCSLFIFAIITGLCCVMENYRNLIGLCPKTVSKKVTLFALCNETRIHSSGAPDCGVVEQENKCNHYRHKHSDFLIQLFKPLTSCTSSPDMLVQCAKSCVDIRTCALKPTNLYTAAKSVWKPGDFLKAHS